MPSSLISRSTRNLLLILGSCAIFDTYIAAHTNVDQLYRDWIRPVALDRMIEPYVATLSFMAAAFLFTVVLWWNHRYKRMQKQQKQQQQKRENLHSSKLADSDAGTARNYDEIAAAVATGAPILFAGNLARADEMEEHSFVRGNKGKWLLWATLNVGVYLGAIDIFQRVSQFDRWYRVDDHFATGALGTGLLRVALEVFASVLCYDAVFAVLHKSFHSHQAPLWWRNLHMEHHDHYQDVSKPLHVMQVFHHHIVDASAQVMCNAAMQQVVGFGFLMGGQHHRHTVSKLLHNIAVTYLLIEAHSGQDYWWTTDKWLFPEWCGQWSKAKISGPMAHQRHHQTGGYPYHQFFTVFDNCDDEQSREVRDEMLERTTREEKRQTAN